MNKKDSESAAFEEWLSRECLSGDAEEVQRKWESSHEFREWLDDFTAEEAVNTRRIIANMDANFAAMLIPKEPMNEDIPEETKAALIARGYEPNRHEFDPRDPWLAPKKIAELNAYYETQTDWWVSPDGNRVHWSEVEL